MRPAVRSLLPVLVALLAIMLQASGHPVQANVVSNVAQATWEKDGDRRSIASNRVDTQVHARAAFTLSAFRVNPQGVSTPLATPSCQGSGGVIPAPLSSAYAGLVGRDARISATDQVHAGEPLIVQVGHAEGNRDSGVIEAITGAMVTRSGDREILTIWETGPNTGIFVGYIQTRGAPPAMVRGDCVLTVEAGDKISAQNVTTGNQRSLSSAEVDVLIDPYGLTFDSDDGAPVNGARVTIVDADSGQPAEVFGDDGRSRYPASVVTGQSVVDASGNVYPMSAGDYRFPLLRAGRYRLKVDPPTPYAAPSTATPASLAELRRPDGLPFAILDGSYGGVIILSDPAPVRVDIPIDRPSAVMTVTKTASQAQAMPGELVLYTVTVNNPDATRTRRGVSLTDILPADMRLRSNSIRVDGRADAGAITISADGRTLMVALGSIAPAGHKVIRYALEVRLDAREGTAVNRAEILDARGNRSSADVAVRIRRDSIAGRMTIIGRVVDGDCAVDPAQAAGVAGVRIMLEDGSYAVTDSDGRYHFDGVLPGTHVAQMDPASLGGRTAFDCARSSRSGGSPLSRFVEGQGGALVKADFFAGGAATAGTAAPAQATEMSDPAAAGAERNWFAGGKADIAWLFPEIGHNPRAPVVRVAIRHLPGQTVELKADGIPVDRIAFEGSDNSPAGDFAVSLWRGIPLVGRTVLLTAQVRNRDGSVAATLERPVHFADTAASAQFLPDKSHLVADGPARPVIALRIVDRHGRPVHHGMVGEVGLSAPYQAAMEGDAQQARLLSGMDRARPTWRVSGDDGIARIELAPTSVSGAVAITLKFQDGTQTREQRIDAWLEPGAREWTVVGFASGSLGFQTLDGHLESLRTDTATLAADARLALYAKGRVKGQWLLTMAYDSDRDRDQSRFGGTIDPDTYYTVYADRSERRFDAASVRKLYLRLERRQFYAMFGDYQTGFDETQLGRYVRAANGVKAEYRGKAVTAMAFATDSSNSHRRDEMQGTGLSGPYALSARDVLPNSETVTVETRDRLRSEQIVERTVLARLIDYDMDYAAGTIRLREPLLSRSTALDPQFLVVDFEVEEGRASAVNGGARASWTSAGQALRVGATLLRDADQGQQVSVLAGDVRVRIGTGTEVRAEMAASRMDGAEGDADHAWQVTAEHRAARGEIALYAREQGDGFGIAQQNAAERGRRKYGVDALWRLTDPISITIAAWQDESLADAGRRRAGKALLEYRHGLSTFRAGISMAKDRLPDGGFARSQIAQIGATQRLFDKRLELDAQAEFALQDAASIDFPARHQFSACYAITPDVRLMGIYEMAQGETLDARTFRIGFDVKPWTGGRATTSVARQDIHEYGQRAFAAYGLAQSLPIGKRLTVDLSLDGSRTIGGIDPASVLNRAHPVASGGTLGSGGTDSIVEDFTALSAGATWRADHWSATGRAEYRAGQMVDRSGLVLGLVRQLGGGSMLGAGLTWAAAARTDGPATTNLNMAASLAHRPQYSPWAIFEKIELRTDSVRDAVLGEAGPIGQAPLTVSGDVTSRRVVNSLSFNYAPYGRDADGLYQRSEVSLFWGCRYMFDRYDDLDLAGWSNLIGVDARLGLGERFEVGLSASVRGALHQGNFAFAAGPHVGVRAVRNGLLTLGWNIAGFEDRDFSALRQSRSGPYVSFRLKFDQTDFAFLGMSR